MRRKAVRLSKGEKMNTWEKAIRIATRLALLDELEEELEYAWREKYEYDPDIDLDPDLYETESEFLLDLEELYGWRKYVEDGSRYHLDPYDFETKEEYEEALEAAREASEKAESGWREKYEWDSELDLDPEDFDTEEEYGEALEAAREALENVKYGWREDYAWDSEFNLDPEDFETEAEYEEALEEAKYGWRNHYEWDTELNLDPDDYETEEEFKHAMEEKQAWRKFLDDIESGQEPAAFETKEAFDEQAESDFYEWRSTTESGEKWGVNPKKFETEAEYLSALEAAKYGWRSEAEDGSLFGVDPLDYEKENDYKKALVQGRKTYYRNKRTYDAAEYYRETEPEFRRAGFILQGLKEESCIASRYCTMEGEFLFAQAVSDHFTLPVQFAKEDERQKNSLYKVINRIGGKNPGLAVAAWRWCLAEFSPYSEYMEYPEELFNGVIDGMNGKVLSEVVIQCGQDPTFADQFLKDNPESPETDIMSAIITEALEHDSGETAVMILKSYLSNPHVNIRELLWVLDDCIEDCSNYVENETMKKLRDLLMPVFASSELLEGKTNALAVYKKKIADYILEYE